MKYIILVLILVLSTNANASDLVYRPLAGQDPQPFNNYRTQYILQQQANEELLRRLRQQQYQNQYYNNQPIPQPSGADYNILKEARY